MLMLDVADDSIKELSSAILHTFRDETIHLADAAQHHKNERRGVIRRMSISRLPPVLVIQLKRFRSTGFGDLQQVTKITRGIGLQTELSIPQEVLSPSCVYNNGQPYQLQAVIYHHGADASSGHYTATVRIADTSWRHIDDATVAPVSEAQVISGAIEASDANWAALTLSSSTHEATTLRPMRRTIE